jgi:hypothetical protein
MNVRSWKFHIGFWIVYIIIFTVVKASYKEEYLEAFLFEITNLPMKLLVVYFNYFLLIPKLLLQDKTIKYFGYSLLTIAIAGIAQRFINFEIAEYIYASISNKGFWLPYKFIQAMMLIASPLVFIASISIISKVAELQKAAKTLESEKLQAELKYLKSQVNPHFLFNTLNNIYSLALNKSNKTPGLILKLSDFLSFSLYESGKKLILLEKEISLMNDFIALERSRFEDRINIQVELPEHISKIMIPPLIFVPFVENAFKHSLRNETEIANVFIKLSVEHNSIVFNVKNSKPEESEINSNKNGLGLINIKKRLEIIYKDRYSLEIDDRDLAFSINLKLEFDA